MRPPRKAAIALIAGATIHAIAGIVGQVLQGSTLVSHDMFSYPWTSAELVAVSLVEALAFGLGLLGIVITPVMPLGVAVMGSCRPRPAPGSRPARPPLPPRSGPPAPPPRSRCADNARTHHLPT
jgi:hypothetical protein